MNINPNDLDAGVYSGIDRAKKHFPYPNLSLDYDSRAHIENVLRLWPHDLHERFVELFVEIATLASIVRSQNSEPLLTEDELLAFLANSAAFVNSFKHR